MFALTNTPSRIGCRFAGFLKNAKWSDRTSICFIFCFVHSLPKITKRAMTKVDSELYALQQPNSHK